MIFQELLECASLCDPITELWHDIYYKTAAERSRLALIRFRVLWITRAKDERKSNG